MDIVKYVLAIALSASAGDALAQKENYKHMGERPASGQISTPYYTFSYVSPSETYQSITWNAYSDKKEKRNTVLVTGLSGYDTYALSVLYKGQAKEGQSLIDVAKENYPSAAFSVEENPACATIPTDKPFPLSGRMLVFLAICVDEASKSTYEINISWQSLILAMKSLDTVVEQSNQCAADKLKDPAVRCPDYIGAYSASYKTFLSSFSMSGK